MTVRGKVDDAMRRVSPYERITLNVLRIVVGFLLLKHGVQRVPGVAGSGAFSGLAVAGAVEAIGGAMLLVGLWTRPVALALLVAALATAGWRPETGIAARTGETLALYAVTFFYLTARGGGGFGLDGLLRRRRSEPAR